MVGLITKNILKRWEYPKKITSLPVLKFLFLIWKRSTLDSFNCGGLACRDCTTAQSGALGIFCANFRGKLYQCVQQLCLQLKRKM